MNSGASAQAGERDVRLERRHKLGEALEHLTLALEVLDQNEASPHIGARVSEAMHWLGEEIDSIK